MLEAYATMLPRLEAEDQLHAVDAVAAGAGAMASDDHKVYLRQLRDLAEAHVAARKATEADLMAMGIAVERG